jgi:outer membrane protein OmpA-like peptidoglycan-associated protein
MRRTWLAFGLGLLLTAPLAAQRRGGWELGGFGRYNWYDGSFNIIDSTKEKNSFGGGARVGWFFTPRWALELDGSLNATDVDRPLVGATSVGLVYLPFHLRLMYNLPLGGERFFWLGGAGINYNRYRVSSEADDFLEKRFEGDDWGAGLLTGFRYYFTDWLSARADLAYDYIPSPQNDPNGSNGMWGAQAGLSIHLGTRCTDRLDSIRVEPRNATLYTGESVTFRVAGTLCDGRPSDAAAGTAATLAGGDATVTGLTFTSTMPGTYTVRFNNPAARRRPSDQATVTVRARPDTTPRMVRVDLQPDSATIYAGERIELRVIGHLSNNTTRTLTDCQLTPDGGRVSAGGFSADQRGRYTVTAICAGGLSDRSVIVVEQLTLTVRALFRFDQTNVGDSIRAELDTLRWLARQLAQRPSIQLTIYGHTDFIGTDEYNCNLAWWRIEAVVDSLRSFGAPADRLSAISRTSFGERQPPNPGRTAAARAENRRVDLVDSPTAQRTPRYDASRACGPATRPRRP